MNTQKNSEVKTSTRGHFSKTKDHSLRIKEKETIYSHEDYTIKEKQRTEKFSYYPTGLRTVVKQNKQFLMTEEIEVLIVETETFIGEIGQALTPLFTNTKIQINPLKK